MKNSKHTKGPWIVEFNLNKLSMNGQGTSEVHGPKGIISVCEESDIVEQNANAHLIAAAPEMLEALDLVKNFINELMTSNPDEIQDRLTNNAEQIESAIEGVIKKARGEA